MTGPDVSALPPIFWSLSEISEILIDARRSAEPSSIHYRADLCEYFSSSRLLPALAYFLKVRTAKRNAQSADAFAPMLMSLALNNS